MTPENTDNFKRFDMKRPPKLCPWYLKPIAWAISFPWVWKHKTEVTKINMEGIKPPYVLLGNHNAFYDMPVAATATFPYFGNFIVALDGFIGREWLLRRIGCIAKRKFTQDLTLIKHLKLSVFSGVMINPLFLLALLKFFRNIAPFLQPDFARPQGQWLNPGRIACRGPMNMAQIRIPLLNRPEVFRDDFAIVDNIRQLHLALRSDRLKTGSWSNRILYKRIHRK